MRRLDRMSATSKANAAPSNRKDAVPGVEGCKGPPPPLPAFNVPVCTAGESFSVSEGDGGRLVWNCVQVELFRPGEPNGRAGGA